MMEEPFEYEDLAEAIATLAHGDPTGLLDEAGIYDPTERRKLRAIIVFCLKHYGERA